MKTKTRDSKIRTAIDWHRRRVASNVL